MTKKRQTVWVVFETFGLEYDEPKVICETEELANQFIAENKTSYTTMYTQEWLVLDKIISVKP